MSEQIVGASALNSYGYQSVSVEKNYRLRYEVWTDKTLVLRTTHEVQAIRYAREVKGEVRTVEYSRP